MVLLTLSEAEIEAIGLRLAGFDYHRQARTCSTTNRERYRGSYGASPKAHAAIFVDLQTTTIAEAFMGRPFPNNFLMALNWLKTYKTENQMDGHFKCEEKTATKWIWIYASKIQALKTQKVKKTSYD